MILIKVVIQKYTNHLLSTFVILCLCFFSAEISLANSILISSVIRTKQCTDIEISSICGENSSPYAERVRLIHRLPSNLAPEQLERCRAFLESPLAGQPLPDLEFNGLKNELVFALLRQREGLTELAELLVRMSRAPDTDATWRDYCVQFLGKCYPRIHDAKSREAMADALWEALKTQRRGRAAGSAARQLMTLGRTFPEFPPEKVAASSLEALLDPVSSDETRTALLQVCGTRGERGALPLARTLASRSASAVLHQIIYEQAPYPDCNCFPKRVEYKE